MPKVKSAPTAMIRVIVKAVKANAIFTPRIAPIMIGRTMTTIKAGAVNPNRVSARVGTRIRMQTMPTCSNVVGMWRR